MTHSSLFVRIVILRDELRICTQAVILNSSGLNISLNLVSTNPVLIVSRRVITFGMLRSKVCKVYIATNRLRGFFRGGFMSPCEAFHRPCEIGTP